MAKTRKHLKKLNAATIAEIIAGLALEVAIIRHVCDVANLEAENAVLVSEIHTLELEKENLLQDREKFLSLIRALIKDGQTKYLIELYLSNNWGATRIDTRL